MTPPSAQSTTTELSASDIETHVEGRLGLIIFKPYIDALTEIIDKEAKVKSEFEQKTACLDLFVLLQNGQAEQLMESGMLWRKASLLARELKTMGSFTTAQAQTFILEELNLIEEHIKQIARNMAYEDSNQIKDSQIEFRAYNKLLTTLRVVHHKIKGDLNTSANW